ncbi:MAG TPA: M28 family peptidase [Anaerolineaceae bacterium]
MQKPAWRRLLIALLILIAVLSFGFVAGYVILPRLQAPEDFDGQKAYQDVVYQVGLGPRVPGSDAHQKFIDWLKIELTQYHWQVEIQEGSLMGHPIQNVIARKGSGAPWIILGAHYDSRLWADKDLDPARRKDPVPGADDGASGVAVLLGLARSIPDNSAKQIWLVFFDAEDNGDIPGWDWLLGSRYFVSKLTCCPSAVVVVDMVGDKNQTIYEERNSNPEIVRQIWAQAAHLGYTDKIIPQLKYSMEDDHTPFLEAGIPAIDMIDFDYPYWHTTQDTADKVSPESLYVIGRTLLSWLKKFPF